MLRKGEGRWSCFQRTGRLTGVVKRDANTERRRRRWTMDTVSIDPVLSGEGNQTSGPENDRSDSEGPRVCSRCTLVTTNFLSGLTTPGLTWFYTPTLGLP